ncbi:hypothetical protein GCM10022216_32040 [Sphingobacterium kyonggiense]|uniref:Helix-turn-helix domain-containing protein n=1 Tax=Sphingobacterium kyonggiense TaxID=714075 RepID=A0ABP7Z439_9SPHI
MKSTNQESEIYRKTLIKIYGQMSRRLNVMEEILKQLAIRNKSSEDKEAFDPFEEGATMELLDANDVMKILKISQSTYYRLVKTGVLKPIVIGRRHYYSKQQVEGMLKSRMKR